MGVGGGFIMVPALIYLLHVPTNVVIGTSLFQIIFVTAFTTVLQSTTNQTVDIVLALVLMVGGVIGAQFGAAAGLRLARRPVARIAGAAGAFRLPAHGLRTHRHARRPLLDHGSSRGELVRCRARGSGLAPRRRCLILALTMLAGRLGGVQAQQAAGESAEQIQMGISTDVIGLTSDFSGTSIAVFGTIENANRVAQTLNEYAIVVVIRGPLGDYVIRRKERVAGIWVNRSSRTYRAVPSFYALTADRPLEKIAEAPLLKEHRARHRQYRRLIYIRAAPTSCLRPNLPNRCVNSRSRRNLFTEDLKGVEFLGSTLFRATLCHPLRRADRGAHRDGLSVREGPVPGEPVRHLPGRKGRA